MIPTQQGVDAEALTRRARLLLVVLMLSFGNVIFTALVHAQLGNDAFSRGMSLVALVSISFACALKAGVPVPILTHGAVGTVFVVSLAVAVATAGRVAGGLFFLVLVPAVAILLVSRKAGVVWASVGLLSVVGLSWVANTGGLTPVFELDTDQARDANLRSAALVMLAVTALAHFYSSLHQRANDALRRSVAAYQQGESRFRAITEYAYDLIAELDGEGRFVFASPGYEEVLGWRPERLVGTGIRDWVHFEDAGKADRYWAELNAKGAVRQEPIRLRTASGNLRWLEVSMRIYSLPDGESRVAVVARDVTERLEREDLMRQQHRLVAGGTMAAGAAHQLNNPLGAILVAAQYANQFKGSPEFGELAGDSLDAIEEEARRGGQILRSMLAFARQENSERWTEDVKGVLKRAVRAVELEEPDSDAEIVLSLCREKATVLMSPIEIEQVVINLVRNGIQAGAGVIVLGLMVVDQSTVQITVSDDGPGVGKLTEWNLFDAFFTTHPDSGSGLGLTVGREIVESHVGEISLVRSDSEGSVFRVELPLAHGDVRLLRPLL